MSNQQQALELFTDEQIEHFIIHGYALVKTGLPLEFHDGICAEIDTVFDELGRNPRNEILDRVPKLNEVYDDPAVRGALTSILGADYTMNPHRHCHYSKAHAKGGHWHQDGRNQRHHRIQCVLAMYYPQTVTEDMGPTIVLPGTQYHNTPSTYMGSYMNFESQVALSVEVGTVAIVHYDIWHAWMDNNSDKDRRMLKFLFNRSSDPSEPSWNHDPNYVFNPNAFSLPIEGQSDAYKHRAMWMSIWDWLRGE